MMQSLAMMRKGLKVLESAWEEFRQQFGYHLICASLSER